VIAHAIRFMLNAYTRSNARQTLTRISHKVTPFFYMKGKISNQDERYLQGVKIRSWSSAMDALIAALPRGV
jgi:hypothetical protein